MLDLPQLVRPGGGAVASLLHMMRDARSHTNMDIGADGAAASPEPSETLKRGRDRSTSSSKLFP